MVGRKRWFQTRSADLFYKDYQHYIDCKCNKGYPLAIEIPYWKCSETDLEDILQFCLLHKSDYYVAHPFVNREVMVSEIDSVLQLCEEL